MMGIYPLLTSYGQYNTMHREMQRLNDKSCNKPVRVAIKNVFKVS